MHIMLICWKIMVITDQIFRLILNKLMFYYELFLTGALGLSSEIILPPKTEIFMIVQYEPKFATVSSSTVQFLILNNTYEDLKVNLTGTGVSVDLLLEGLDLGQTESDGKSKKYSIPHYKLNFEHCLLGNKYKKSFVLKNQSNKIFRFIWENCPHLKIFPRLGQIMPGSSKTMHALLSIEECLKLQQVIILTSN